MWTIETVKAELPKVQVQIEVNQLTKTGKTKKVKMIVEGNVSGRRNKFPTIWTKDNMQGWEFAWGTIANALNNNKPLLV